MPTFQLQTTDGEQLGQVELGRSRRLRTKLIEKLELLLISGQATVLTRGRREPMYLVAVAVPQRGRPPRRPRR
jgi:hypothetical protein